MDAGKKNRRDSRLTTLMTKPFRTCTILPP
jgi:hypothetical protein